MKVFFLFPVFILLFGACSSTRPVVDEQNATRLASTFPDRAAQSAYTDFTASVCRLTAFVNYRTLVFEPDSLILVSEIGRRSGPGITRARLTRNESFSGTATVIAVSGNRGLLLTCAHNVVFPDSVFTYNDKANLQGKRFLLGLSEKTGAMIQVSGPYGTMQGEVIASDAENDLALLEVKGSQIVTLPVPVKLRLATISELHWGDRVWLTGYPSGRNMMTTGVLSIPGSGEGVLLTDAPFSEGYSGAPAIIYDRLAGEFLLAGVGRSVAARSEYVLKPEKKIHEQAYNTALPYQGPAYVEVEKQAAPGVTFITSSGTIERFIGLEKEQLEKRGWVGILKQDVGGSQLNSDD
jgi:hypothetical protein